MPATVSFPTGPATVNRGVWTAIQQPRLQAALNDLDYGNELTIASDRDRLMADVACRKLGGQLVSHRPDYRFGEGLTVAPDPV